MLTSIRKPATTRAMRPESERGFTLVEVIITVVILGALTAFAIPGYQNYLLSTRRSDAQDALILAQLQLEQCKNVDKIAYDACTNLGAVDADGNTAIINAAKHYDITVSFVLDAGGVPTDYTLTAVPKAASPQASDSNCTNFTLNRVLVHSASNPDCLKN